MKIPMAIVSVMLLLVVGDCWGEVYRYRDSGGELHFVDDISRVPKKYRNRVEPGGSQGTINVADRSPVSERVAGNESVQAGRTAAYTGADIEVFMTSWCGYCRKMVRFLREKGIPFTPRDIENDGAAARTYRELGGAGVPVVRIGSHVVHGYNPEAVMRYYNEGK